MKPDHVIFVHIPKTAGSTLNKILRDQYGRRHTFWMHPPHCAAEVASFCARSEEELQKIRLVQGHWPYGLHSVLPGTTSYIAVMRAPVDRLISLYYYIRRNPVHYLYDRVADGGMSLDEFVSSNLTCELDNGQLRLLAGCEREVSFGGITEEHLALAKRNIENNFASVGLTHRFNETLLLFYMALGWKRLPYYHNRNVTAKRPAVESLSPEVMAITRDRNQYEIELFDWVSKRFDEQIDGFDDFQDTLKRFRYRNAVFQKWTPDIRRPKWMKK